jgi:hypothetical protein
MEPKEKIPENFFYNDTYYHNLEDLASDCEDMMKEVSDDEEIEIGLSDEAPIVQLSPSWILDRINEDAFCEDTYERDSEKIKKILEKNIDFQKLNEEIPKLFYGNNKTLKIRIGELKTYL